MARLSDKEREYRRQYSKQKYRINRYIRDLQERGYAFNEDLTVDSTPTKIGKKDVERLKKTTWKKILRSAYYETDKGVKISGTKAHKIIAAEKRAKTISSIFNKPIEDEELLFDKLYIMLDVFNARDRFKGKIAVIVQEANDELKFWIQQEDYIQGHDNFVRHVASNYPELVDCVDKVQSYINVAEESRKFKDLISSRPLSLKENMEMTERYDDSDMLSEEEISDYDIIADE